MSRSRKRIFISYSHDSDEHRARVLQLANSLRQYGLVDVRLDQFEVDDPPVGWPLWMETELELAQKVLLVCTETYDRRVKKKEAPGIGRGVCWEANLIYAELYESQTNSNKFIPVIFRAEDRQFIPKPLGTASFFLVEDADGFKRLYRRLTGQSHQPKQQPGELVSLPLPEPLPLFVLPSTAPASYGVATEPPELKPVVVPSVPASAVRRLKSNDPPPARFELRALDWYDEPDAAYFHGRDADIKALRTLLLDEPVVRLFGPSGVGKSSLLRAGLLPALRKLGWRIAVVRPFDQPEMYIPRLIGEQLLTDDSPPLAAALELSTLQAELAPALAVEHRAMLFLLIDQVEDVVSPFAPPEARERLVEFLRQVWNADERSRPQVRILLAYRTDAETRLARLWQEVSGDSSGLPYHAIQGLSQSDARRVIAEAAEQKGWILPDDLDELVAELERESRPLDCSGDVFPPYLQMVLTRLAHPRETSADGDAPARIGPVRIGVRGLIGEYLHNQFQQLEQRDGDFTKCRPILEALSRSSGQKLSLTHSEIAAAVGLSREAVSPLLTELHRFRLIRPVGNDTWEIQHDRLAEVIIEGMSDADREFKAARELLSAKAINHGRTGEWLTPSELHLLYVHFARLSPSHRELYLILGSVMASQIEASHYEDRHVPGWLHVCNLASDQQIQFLRELTCDIDEDVRQVLVKVFSCFVPPDALPLLRQLARDEDEYVRGAAVEAIGRFLQTDDLPLLRVLARDENENKYVRSEAVEAIGRLAQTEDLPLLRKLARDEDLDVRLAAVKAIGGFAQTEALPLLRDLACDEDSDVRQAAVEAIGGFAQTELLPVLRELARDKDSDVRRAAVKAIGRFAQSEALPLLRELAREKSLGVRQVAVEAIGGLAQLEDLSLMRELARDQVTNVRRAATEAIGRFAKTEALPQLRELARDQDWDVRWAAVEAIGRLAQAEDLPLLRELACDQDGYTRRPVVEAIGRLAQAEDLPLLRELALDEDGNARVAAVEALGRFAQSEDLPLLRELAHDRDENVRQAAVETLYKIDGREELREWFMNALVDLEVDVVARLDYLFFAPDWWRNVVQREQQTKDDTEDIPF